MDEFEKVIKEGVDLQKQLPWLQLVAVGGTAAAMHAMHRFSTDTDHVADGVKDQLEIISTRLEEWEGWKTNRIRKPYVILGERHGVEMGVRHKRRVMPLEVVKKEDLLIPTAEETLRIKAFMMFERQATRDYLDVAALLDKIGEEEAIEAMSFLNVLYPGRGNQTALTCFADVAHQDPLDLDEVNLKIYKGIQKPYDGFQYVSARVQELGKRVLEREMNGLVAVREEQFTERVEKNKGMGR